MQPRAGGLSMSAHHSQQVHAAPPREAGTGNFFALSDDGAGGSSCMQDALRHFKDHWVAVRQHHQATLLLRQAAVAPRLQALLANPPNVPLQLPPPLGLPQPLLVHSALPPRPAAHMGFVQGMAPHEGLPGLQAPGLVPVITLAQGLGAGS